MYSFLRKIKSMAKTIKLSKEDSVHDESQRSRDVGGGSVNVRMKLMSFVYITA
jgi:hypothetical protein